MAYFTPEDIQQAKQLDLLTYLQIYEPDQLVKVSGDTYLPAEHAAVPDVRRTRDAESESATGNGTGFPGKQAAGRPLTIS